jgi:hypothetical protein
LASSQLSVLPACGSNARMAWRCHVLCSLFVTRVACPHRGRLATGVCSGHEGTSVPGVTTMEERLYADWAALRCLMRTHPDWTQQEWAAHIGRSVGWVKKWAQRLRAAPLDDSSVLWSRSRALLSGPRACRAAQPPCDVHHTHNRRRQSG